jgi:large subunit ribosomal protein L23
MAINIFKKNKKVEKEESEKEKKSEAAPEEKKVSPIKNRTSKNLSQSILIRPYVTEKASQIASENKYVFLVHPKANKPAIKKEISRRYGVKVLRINMIRKTKRPRRWGYKKQRPKILKKAVVTLAKGQKLEIT